MKLIMSPGSRIAERLTTPFAYHGEGPFWDTRTNRLLCLDVLDASVVAVGSDAAIQRHSLPTRAATVIRRRVESGFIIATERGVVLADDDLTSFRQFAELTKDADVRTNDGGCDPLGGFVIGTMSYRESPSGGTVYRIAPDGGITEILSPVSISNGIQWTGDGAHVFYVDTPTRRVDVFEVDPYTGAWSGRRTHISLDGGRGFPDGMAIDEEGGLWLAMWGAGAVYHYDDKAQLVETVTIPGVTQVSSCTFGGDNGSVLFVTTSRQGLPAHQESDAGAVFVIQTSVRGAMQAEFAG